MDWLKKIFSIESTSQQPAPPPATGDSSGSLEVSNSQKMAEKRKKRQEQEKAADGNKLVVSGAKIQCTLCTNPMGTLNVVALRPSIQNKPIANTDDKGKMNLMFTGTCTKSPNAAAPCIAVIQPGQWQDTGSFKVQGKAPLLMKSTIKCMFGGVDIKFIDSGQVSTP